MSVHNYTWRQGEDLTLNIVYQVDGVPVDMTDWDVRMDIAPQNSRDAIFSLNSIDLEGSPLDETGVQDNEIITDAQGNITIIVSRELTLGTGPIATALTGPSTTFSYDIFIRNKTTNLQRYLLEGTITVKGSITKWL